MARLAHRHLPPDVLDDVLHGPAVEAHALLVAAVPGRKVLAHADRPEGVGAGVDGLALAQEREVGAAAADLGHERIAAGESRVVAERLAHGHVAEAVLLGPVDHLDVDAGAQPNPVEERVPVDGLAHGARRHRAVPDDAVRVHDPAEALERAQGRLDRRRAESAAREGVAAELDGPRRLFEDARRLAGRQLRHDEPDGARPHVEDGHGPTGGALAGSGGCRIEGVLGHVPLLDGGDGHSSPWRRLPPGGVVTYEVQVTNP